MDVEDAAQLRLPRQAAPSIIEPVQRLKVADAVSAQLTRLIIAGEYDEAGRLPAERVLADQFGVGRSSMREALRSLEADGLVRVEHGVGVFVLDEQHRAAAANGLLVTGRYTVPELFEVRIPLERDAAGLAARRISTQEAEELVNILHRADDLSISDEQFVELDLALHALIMKASKNTLLQDVMSGLRPLFHEYSHRVIALPNRRATAQVGHRSIVEAVTQRRVREARAAAVRHIREVEKDIVTHLHPDNG